MLAEFLGSITFQFFIVFARLGAMFMTMPAISHQSVNPRARLMLAFAVSFAIFPILEPKIPLMPDSGSGVLQYMLIELVIGVMFGIGMKLFMVGLNIAGDMIGFTSGFQAATLFDPSSGSQTTAPAAFLMMLAVVLILATNLHHMMIEGLTNSFSVFPPGQMPYIGDATDALLTVVSNAFEVGLQICSPIMVVGFLGYVSFGIFNRLIPQLHVFFVAMPITIAAGLLMLGITLATMLMLFMSKLQENAIIFTLN